MMSVTAYLVVKMINKSEIELISFDLCPYVQRSVITLHEKGIEFKRINIDLMNKPEWFLRISPLAKVPVMRIGDQILFESAVINEYLDEITPPSLHPEDPFVKAQNRAWIEYGGTLFGASFRHLAAKDEQGSREAQDEIMAKLEYLEQFVAEDPFFNGEKFSLIDAAFAPFFLRTERLSSKACGVDLLAETPRIASWSKNLLARDSVQSSIPENFDEIAPQRFAKAGGWLARKYLGEL